MYDEQVIGIVYRHGFNDYEIMLDKISQEDSDAIEEIMMKYTEPYGCCGGRGDRTMALVDCNIEYVESDFEAKYKATNDETDIVTISEIFNRYIETNGTYKGFEEYVDSGFMNGNEKEYEEV